MGSSISSAGTFPLAEAAAGLLRDLRLADLSVGPLVLPGGGRADPLASEAAIDTANCTGQTYNGTDDSYGNTVTGAQSLANSTSSFGGSNNTLIDRTTTIANGTTISALGISLNSAKSGTLFLVERSGAGTYTELANVSFSHSGGGGFEYTALAVNVTLGNGTFHVAAHVQSPANGMTATPSVSGAYKSGAGVGSGFTEASVQVYSTAAQAATLDMVIRTASQDVGDDFRALDLAAIVEPVDALTLNTDLIAAASADGGATFNNVTLRSYGAVEGSKLLLFGRGTAGGSGDDMVLKLAGANAKRYKLFGIAGRALR